MARLGWVRTREIIRASHRAILGRNPSPEEMRGALERLSLSSNSLEETVESVLRSGESARRNLPSLLGLTLFEAHPGTITSLGTHCYASQLLKTLGLKKWSGPFDWIFSSIPMVTHCIQDDFRIFLDRTFLEPVAIEKRYSPELGKCDHRYYRDHFQVYHVFNHHDAHTDEVHAYFTRCVRRLREHFQKPVPKTFLLCAHQSPDFVPQLLELRSVLKTVCERFRILAIGVGPSEGNVWAQPALVHEEDCLHVYSLTPSSPWLPLHFSDSIDDLCITRLIQKSVLR